MTDPTESADAAVPASVPRGIAAIYDDALAQDFPAGTLYVIATPIGNRADVTIRALACLARVDAVAAEDTRTTRALLHHYGIDRPMIAVHRHNENEAAEALVRRLAEGARIAYVSDAGTPGISDPGARLAAAAHDAGHRVLPIPGASALTAALSAAGLPDGPVLFVGFLPAKASQAASALDALGDDAHLVIYEAPHRIVSTLAMLAQHYGDERWCVIARELTKRFETIHRGTLGDAVPWIEGDPQRQRGEFVVIVEAGDGADEVDATLTKALAVLDKLSAKLSLSDAASLAADITGVSRKKLYAEALKRRDG